MIPIERDITNVRGDTFAFAFKCPKTVEVASMYFTISTVKDMEDTSKYLVHKSVGDGIYDLTQQGDEQQTWQVRVAPKDTNNLPVGRYYYDFQVGFGVDIYTIMMGRYANTYDFTREVE